MANVGFFFEILTNGVKKRFACLGMNSEEDGKYIIRHEAPTESTDLQLNNLPLLQVWQEQILGLWADGAHGEAVVAVVAEPTHPFRTEAEAARVVVVG